jgi:hypothetical protein
MVPHGGEKHRVIKWQAALKPFSKNPFFKKMRDDFQSGFLIDIVFKMDKVKLSLPENN